MQEMMDSRLWKQRRQELRREVELNRLTKALRTTRKRRTGRSSVLAWEINRQAGVLLKILRRTLRNAGY